MMYEFTSVSGRRGIGWSSWQALVAAIGSAEAEGIPGFSDVDWVSTPQSEKFAKEGRLMDEDGELLGTMRQFRD